MNPQLRRSQFDHLAAVLGAIGGVLVAASGLLRGTVLGAIGVFFLVLDVLVLLRRTRAEAAYRIPLVPDLPRWVHGTALAVALAGCGVLGYVVGDNGRSTVSPQMTDSTSNYDVRVNFPARWRDRSLSHSQLSIREPILLLPDVPRGAKTLVGLAPAAGPTLLPTSVRARLDRLPTPQRVSLGHLQAYGYEHLRLRGFGSEATVLVAPVTTPDREPAVVTVACFAPRERQPVPSARCEQIAATVTLKRGRPLPLGPSPRYAVAVNRLLRGLRQHRARAHAQMGDAPTPRRQAQIAHEASDVYERATVSLRAIETSPADQPTEIALASALRVAAAGYAALASAAQRNDASAWERAAHRVQRDTDRVQHAVERFRTLGYAVPG